MKSDGDLTGDEVGRIARNVPVGDVDKLRSGELFEIGAGQMLRGADANRAVIELLGALFRIIDQVEERFGRKFRVDDDDIGESGEQTDWCKVLLRIVTEFLEQSFVCSQRPSSVLGLYQSP